MFIDIIREVKKYATTKLCELPFDNKNMVV